MVVKKLEEELYLDALKISEYAFQYKVKEEHVQTQIDIFKKHHQLYGILDEGELVAKLHLLPLEVYLGEESWKMGGIAGVATYPEYRRRGYVKEMLKYVLKTMKSEGLTVSMLHPFSIPFYRKFGWELLSNRVKCTLSKGDLVMKDPVDGTIKRQTQKPNFPEMSKVYEHYAKGFSGMLVRDQAWWENNYKEFYSAIYYDSLKKPMGYVLYNVRDSKMKIEEFVAVTKEARQGLWNFICQHDSMINELELITYERDPLLFSLENPKVKMELLPYFMVRIVDALAFLKNYSFNWDDNEEVLIKVTDEFAPWNERTFRLKDKNIIDYEEEVVNNDKVLHLSINALSTALFGYKRPLELYQIGCIAGNEEEVQKLEKMIPNHHSFFYDFF